MGESNLLFIYCSLRLLTYTCKPSKQSPSARVSYYTTLINCGYLQPENCIAPIFNFN